MPLNYIYLESAWIERYRNKANWLASIKYASHLRPQLCQQRLTICRPNADNLAAVCDPARHNSSITVGCAWMRMDAHGCALYHKNLALFCPSQVGGSAGIAWVQYLTAANGWEPMPMWTFRQFEDHRQGPMRRKSSGLWLVMTHDNRAALVDTTCTSATVQWKANYTLEISFAAKWLMLISGDFDICFGAGCSNFQGIRI